MQQAAEGPSDSPNTLVEDEVLQVEIARKTRELVHAYPLAGFTGSVDAISTSTRAKSDPGRAVPHNSGHDPSTSCFRGMPELDPYRKQLDAMVTARFEGREAPDPALVSMGRAAYQAFQEALATPGGDLKNIVWKDPPYATSASTPRDHPYQLQRPNEVQQQDLANTKSIAMGVLFQSRFPYPSPAPAPGTNTASQLKPVPPPSYMAGREDASGRRSAAATAYNDSKTFFNTFMQEQMGRIPHHKDSQATDSPIPRLPLSPAGGGGSSPFKPSTPAQRFPILPSSASAASSSPLPMQAPEAFGGSSAAGPSSLPLPVSVSMPSLSPFQGRPHLAPLVPATNTSSPDPMNLIYSSQRPKANLPRSKSSNFVSTGRHATPTSSPAMIPVVEIPVMSNHKRKMSETEARLGSIKLNRASHSPSVMARKHSAPPAQPVFVSNDAKARSKHGPFSELTSEPEGEQMDMVRAVNEDGDDDEEEDDDNVVWVSSTPGKVSRSGEPEPRESNKMRASQSTKVHPGQSSKSQASQATASTSRKAPLPSSPSKDVDRAMRKLAEYLEDIFETEDSLIDAKGRVRWRDDESNPHFLEASAVKQLCLQPRSMRRIVKLVNALVALPGGVKSFESTDTAQLARLFKMLQRSVKLAESTEILPKGIERRTKGEEGATPSKQATSRSNRARNGTESPAEASGASRRKRNSRGGRKDQDDEEDDSEAYETEDETDDERSLASSPIKLSGGGTKKSKSPDKSKAKRGSAREEASQQMTVDWNDVTLENLVDNLTALQNAILAVDAYLTVLTRGHLPKQLYSEDIISTCLSTLKTQLSAAIYPALDSESQLLAVPLHDDRISTLIREILQQSSTAMARISDLVRQEEMPDAIIINTIYLAITPFFVEQGLKVTAKNTAFGSSEMKSIRNEALSIVRTVFAKCPNQRQWIIEEVLASITKLPELAKRKPQYLLPNGGAIHTISVLLLHIVQSCASGIREKVDSLHKAKSRSRPDHVSDDEDALDVVAVRTAVELAYDSATRCGKAIIAYLLNRSGKAPKNSTTSEAEYKAVLEHLVIDLLVVVEQPEWPSANLMLQLAVKAMSGVLEDPKVSADVNTSKAICLDHLGSIGSKIVQLAAKSQVSTESSEDGSLEAITHIVRNQDRHALRRLAHAEETCIQQLLTLSSSDRSTESAADYASMRWASDLLQALRVLPTLLEDEEIKPKFTKELSSKQAALWELQALPVTSRAAAEENRKALLLAFELLIAVHGLPKILEPLLAQILQSCEGAVIAFRQKALKALGSIVEQDPAIFFQENVRKAVEKRLMDSSPAVRDAALEMLGRYVSSNPKLAAEYLPRIGERITDSGLSVRKRVIKLLKSIYPLLEDINSKIDVCRRLVGRVNDEDENIKDLAVAAVEELFFTTKAAPSRRDSANKTIHKGDTPEDRSTVLMTVAGMFRDRPSPLEEIVRAIIEKHSGKNAKAIDKEILASILLNLRGTVAALVDSLVEAEESANFNIVNCIKTIYILLLADASMLSVDRASALLPYLRSASTPEEQVIAEYLMKIFTSVLPSMTSSSSKFTRDLQETLRSLLNKPAAVGNQALPELVACFSTVVTCQTHDYGKLCNAFSTCYTRLCQGVARLKDTVNPVAAPEKNQLLRSLPILAKLVSLFCQYADFDGLRESSPDAALYVNAISQESIQLQVYHQMIDVYRLTAGTPLHGTALQCLGFLYQAQPMFMLEKASTNIMDKIFATGTMEAKGMLLRIICDFLVSQSGKGGHSDSAGTDVDIHQLIGNTENFADSGVSAAVVQRYLSYIVEAALTPAGSQLLLRPALEAIGFTVKQGLAHPMQCLPVLVALESGPDQSVVRKAFSLHSNLHNKHSALINTRISESIEAAFTYQSRLTPVEQMRGHCDDLHTAKLSRWYALMREKRNWRLDFLKAFVRGLQVDSSLKDDFKQSDIDFARFIAENLACFEYKTQEEVMFVIRTMTSILSVAGMQVYHQLQDGVDADGEGLQEDGKLADAEKDNQNASILKSVVLGFVFCLRAHLKLCYGINEQKLAKYVLGKKSAIGDKPATLKTNTSLALEYQGLPFVHESIKTAEDVAKQRDAYIRLIDSDGSIRDAANDGDEMSE